VSGNPDVRGIGRRGLSGRRLRQILLAPLTPNLAIGVIDRDKGGDRPIDGNDVAATVQTTMRAPARSLVSASRALAIDLQCSVRVLYRAGAAQFISGCGKPSACGWARFFFSRSVH